MFSSFVRLEIVPNPTPIEVGAVESFVHGAHAAMLLNMGAMGGRNSPRQVC